MSSRGQIAGAVAMIGVSGYIWYRIFRHARERQEAEAAAAAARTAEEDAKVVTMTQKELHQLLANATQTGYVRGAVASIVTFTVGLIVPPLVVRAVLRSREGAAEVSV